MIPIIIIIIINIIIIIMPAYKVFKFGWPEFGRLRTLFFELQL